MISGTEDSSIEQARPQLTDSTSQTSAPKDLRSQNPDLNKQAAKKLSLSKKLILFTVMLLCFPLALVFLCRSDENVRLLATEYIVKHEADSGTELTSLRSILAIDFVLSIDKLFQSIERQDSQLTSTMIDWGIDPNSINRRGMSALQYAISIKEPEIALAILERGANPNFGSYDGAPLIEAVQSGNVELTAALLDAGANANVYGDSGFSALMHSVSYDSPEMLRTLLLNNANPSYQTSDKQSALLLAEEQQKDEHARALRVSGATNGLAELRPPPELPIPEEPIAEPEVQTPPPPEKQVEAGQPPPAESPRRTLTGVRGVGRPIGTWTSTGGSLFLTKIELEVRNHGSNEAQNIVVQVRAPNKTMVALTGPPNLPAYGRAVYTAKTQVTTYRKVRLKAFITCDNCYKR